MNRGLLALCLIPIACGPKATPEPKPPTVPAAPDAAAASALPEPPTPIQHSQRAVIESPHAGTIEVLTATPEGDAVLSVDELGGTRLWPALDGSKEPKLVELNQAKALALGHRDTGYTAVALDETGGLYLARLDADGRTLSHTTFGVDPPFVDMVMTKTALVAWRSDHHVLVIDGDGAVKADLPTEPQQRVVDIATNGTNVLALLETDRGRKARWLTLEPKVAWGAWIDHPDAGPIGLAITLAPDASKFAIAARDDAGQNKQAQVTIYDASGKIISSSGATNAADVELAFIDNEQLAIVSLARGILWLGATDGAQLVTPKATGFQPVRQRAQLAAGGGRAILGREGELVLLTPTTTHFLGYQTLAPQVTAPGPAGQLLVAGVQGAVMLDASLREVSRPNLGLKENTPLAAAEWVGNDSWLVESSKTNGKLQLAIVNIKSGAASVVRDELPDVHYLAYEPSTQLVAISFGSKPELAKLDVGKGTLATVSKTPAKQPHEEIAYALLSPALARGQQAVEVTVSRASTVRWLKTPTVAASTLALDGSYLGSDLAGRVYGWHQLPMGKLELAIYLDGKQTGTLPAQEPVSLWPDPTATVLAEASSQGVTLYRGTTSVWTRPAVGLHEVVWLTDGALAVTHTTGIARLDAKTGAITALRCGWEFGLTTKPHPPAPRIEPICSQLAR